MANSEQCPLCDCCHCYVSKIDWNEEFSICNNCFESMLPFGNLDEINFQNVIFEHMSNRNSSSSDNIIFQAISDIFDDHDTDLNEEFLDTYLKSTTQYYSTEKFTTDFKNLQDEHTFSSIHFNARSLPKNHDSIVNLLKLLQFDFDVICLSETWLKDSGEMYSIPNYSFVNKNRRLRAGGGVGIYINNNVHYISRSDVSISDTLGDSVFIEIPIEGKKNVVLGVIYKPPDTNCAQFIEAFDNVISTLVLENKSIYIMGDFNLDLLKYSENNNIKQFFNVMCSNMCLPIISRPTRITRSSATLLDNIITNQMERPMHRGIIYSDVSDHLPIFQISNLNPTSDRLLHAKSNNTCRVITKEKINAFQEELSKYNWSNVLNQDDPDIAYNYFSSVLSTLYDKYFPLKRVKSAKRKLNPWMTSGLLKSVCYKNKLYRKFLKRPSQINELAYKTFRNKLNFLIRKVKSDYYEKKFIACKNDITRTWKVINSILNKKQRDKIGGRMNCNGKMSDDSHTIANSFNDYFVNVGPNLDNKLPQCETHYNKFMKKSFPNTMFLYPTTEHEIIDIVKLLKNNSAPGVDDFSTSVIKHVIEQLSKPLCHIYNQSLNLGIFPTKLKIARVTPIYKSGDKCLLNNYRPISVLSCFSKILERIVYKRLINFLNHNNILSDSQYGFRNKYSTSLALINIANKIVDAFEENSFLIGIFIDLSKAFDTINHNILLAKLNYYGIRGTANNWFHSYLTKRFQCTRYKSCTSDLKEIVCGVPQGSLLGPLLFILYINDLSTATNLFSYILYADDTNIICSDQNINSLCKKVNENLAKISEWFHSNRLSVNTKKCNYMLFSNRLRNVDLSHFHVQLNNINIPRVETTKFLGVHLDSNLTWRSHISEIQTKVSKNVGVMSKLSYMLPKYALRMLYCTLVLPFFSYCNLVWANTFPTSLKQLNALQNKAIRIISHVQPRIHAKPLYQELNLLTMNNIMKYQQAIFIYQCVNGLLPTQFSNMFAFTQDNYNYRTRSSLSRQLIIPRHRTLSFQYNIRYSGPKVWNDLPLIIKSAPTLQIFKSKLKKHFLL